MFQYFCICPKCKKWMVPYLTTTARTFWKCFSCGYDTATVQQTFNTSSSSETFSRNQTINSTNRMVITNV